MTAPRKTIRLNYPVDEAGGATIAPPITEVTIRRPKAKDIRALDAAKSEGEAAQGLLMVQLLSGLSAEVVDEIDADDFRVIAEEAAGFFGAAIDHVNGEA